MKIVLQKFAGMTIQTALFSSYAVEQGHQWQLVLSLRQLLAGREKERVLQSNPPTAARQQLLTKPSFPWSTQTPGLLSVKLFIPAILREKTRAARCQRGEAACCSVVCALFVILGMCCMIRWTLICLKQGKMPPSYLPHPRFPSITETRSHTIMPEWETELHLCLLGRSRAHNADVFTAVEYCW